MKIYAPVKDFNGWRNNVRFVKGVGETDDKWLIQWFVNHGYLIEKSQSSVEKCVEKSQNSLEKCDEHSENSHEKCDEPDFESMTPNELREWMKEHGYGFKIKNIRSKDKLLEIIRG